MCIRVCIYLYLYIYTVYISTGIPYVLIVYERLFSVFLYLYCVFSSPTRLQLPQHDHIRGLCALLCGDSWSLLPLPGRSRAGRRISHLPHLAQPLLLQPHLLSPLLFLSTRGLPQSRHLQKLAEVLGGVHGDPDVHELHPGEGSAQAGPQRY